MSAGFTPGPWHIRKHTCAPDAALDQNDDWTISTDSGQCICWEAGGTQVAPETQANANLIAAAPELYEALRQCRLELSYCADQLAAYGQTGHPEDSVSRALKAGEAALAKARGEQSC